MWRYLLLLPIYLLTTALPLAFTPTSNLEYEYALVASYLALGLIPGLGLALPKKRLATHGIGPQPSAFDVFWTFLIGPLLAITPPAALLSLKVCPCSPPGFYFWMLLQWYPAWILAHAALGFVIRVRMAIEARSDRLEQGRPWSRLKALGSLVAIYAALALGVAFVLWFFPQKRLIDLAFGFLHGPIYDDWIAVDTGIVLGRSTHLVLATLLLLLVWSKRTIGWGVGLATVFGGWLALGLFAGRFPSTQNGKEALARLLPGTLEGDGFTLHYRPEEGSGGAQTSVRRLFRDAQFQIAELSQQLKLSRGSEPMSRHVDIYAYPDEDDKKLWFGGGSTDVTDVRTPSVHINLGSWPHPTLRHELVHALASAFGFHGLGFHPNMAFTEGLAMALAPNPGNLTLDEGSASLLESGRLSDIESLFSPAFWRVSGHRAYTMAGSFLRFLIARFGIEPVKSLYAGESFEASLHQKPSDIISAWREQVLKGYSKEKQSLYAEALFRYPGILQDQCPHSKADLARSRDSGVFTRLRQPIGFDPDNDYLPWLLHLDPTDASSRTKQWKQEIRRLAEDRFPPAGRLKTWQEALNLARKFPPESLEDVELGVLASDTARLLGDQQQSIDILTHLAVEAKRRYFGDSLLREIHARLRIEEQTGSRALEWRQYLAGWRKLPRVDLRVDAPWVETYLQLRNERLVPLTTEKLMALLTQIAPDTALPQPFHHEWYKLLANRLMQQEAYKAAAQAYTLAAKAARGSTQEVFFEHARRAEFYAKLGPLKTKAAPKPL